ncbi:hypothetical protein ACIRL2_46095 [Embleya sp. NPDC127516]|uniref:hypothetical protein n=1 Tax=Embleya sp. NPDC127516 TaxID=3363990 RepID=UPI0037FE2A8D
MTDETWIERARAIDGTGELRKYVAEIRAEVLRVRTGLAFAAWGALGRRAWRDTPVDERPDPDVLLRGLETTTVPPGTPARDAVYRQSLAALLVTLDAADRAALTAWLAGINAHDPDWTA